MNIEDIQKLLDEKKIAELKEALSEMEEADISAMLTEIEDKATLIKVFRLLPKDVAGETFSYMEHEMKEKLIQGLTDTELQGIVDELYMDDTVDLIEEMPSNVVKRILKGINPEERKVVNELLKYPEDSAGSIMTTEFIDLKENMTVKEAFTRIKEKGEDLETILNCYVLDPNRILLGIVTIKQLLLANPDTIIKDLMDDNVIYVNTMDDQEMVAQTFQKYDYYIMPVVDKEKRLVGIITVDDVVDVMEAEATEDIEKMAAITPTDKPYFKIGVIETWKTRIPWLLLLMISATFTGKIIQHYENALASAIALTAFIPMLMDTGGNAGGQASVTIIRALSLGDVTFADAFKVIWKEFKVAFLCGLTLVVANFFKLLYLDKVELMVAAVVCLTLLIAVIVAKLIGCTLPLLAKKIGFDPAVMASPFITTIVDAVSLLSYFAVASWLLGI